MSTRHARQIRQGIYAARNVGRSAALLALYRSTLLGTSRTEIRAFVRTYNTPRKEAP